MPFQFRCPHCKSTLQASRNNIGKRARCKKCGEALKIPAAPIPAAPAQSHSPVADATSPRVSDAVSEASQSGSFEPDFGAITSHLPVFAAGQTGSESSGTESTESPSKDSPAPGKDPFADLPEFQTLQSPVKKQVTADEEFHRLMMADSERDGFVPEPQAAHTYPPDGVTNSAPQTVSPEPAAPTMDHADIASVLDNLDATIQTAVVQQQEQNKKAVSAKFTVQQIRSAFSKPLGDVERIRGLRRKQIQSSIAVAAVPLGFVLFVVGSSIGMLLLYRSWLFGGWETMLHPVLGLAMVLFTIFLIVCWIPTISLLFAGFHLILGRHEAEASATQLTRESQPVMYEFVDQICEKLGSPKPCRIDLNCEFNATASLRRGWLSSGRNDLVLTIGIPFIAVQNAQQLASVIAHEFGHFRQGSAMKTYYVIASLTRWFMWSAYTGPSFFSWFGYLTHLLSGTLSREMEWDADRHSIQLAGSKAFEQSSALLERYGVAYGVTVDNLIMLFQSGVLVDNVPRFMMHIGRTMPASVIRRIAEDTEKQRLDRLDSHPPTRERVKAARELNRPGIVSLDRPATDLIDHWTELCKKITLDYYAENLGFDRQDINETHVTPLEELLRDEHKLLLDRGEKA